MSMADLFQFEAKYADNQIEGHPGEESAIKNG
jgi:hypothetical protein